MTIERRIARLSGLTNEGWEKHSNSWSVWTRFSGPALLMLAAWSRVWLDWWAFAVGIVVVIWIALNPFLFAKSSNPNSYAARGAFGERVWMYRDKLDLPPKHLSLPPLLTVINAVGFAAAVYGVAVLDIWTTSLGLAVHYLGKAWFIDRMVWLADDTRRREDISVVETVISED